MSLMEGLTLSQQMAVQHIDGPLLVLAGPGSGKTRVVTRRVAHLVDAWSPAAAHSGHHVYEQSLPGDG